MIRACGPPRRPDDIVIVAIDDASLQQLGRWPWRRSLHAALLDRLHAAGARAVALDVVFTEPDSAQPQDDVALAAAMTQGTPIALPLIVDWRPLPLGPREILPIQPLSAAAARLAHAHVELDRDGIARSVFLREGLGHTSRPHLALALLEAAGETPSAPLPGERQVPGAQSGGSWSRDYHLLIPFIGPPGRFRYVSYVDVLRGSVPDDVLHGAYVLVGATAQGLADAYPTPRSGEGIAMPGVEISANVLNALRTRSAIRAVPQPWSLLLALLPLVAGFLGFLRLSPRHSLVLIVGLLALTLAASLLTLRHAHWWWPPVPTLLALLLSYPLWAWRRLEATQTYLDAELSRLDLEPLLAFAPDRVPTRIALSDTVQRRIDRVSEAMEQLRHLRQLLSETIAALPDAILLLDRHDRIVLSNPAAVSLLGVPDARSLEGKPIEPFLAPLLAPLGTTYRTLAGQAPASTELREAGGRELMLRVAPFDDHAGQPAGSVLDIADISDIKSAERERDDTIRFLSHDLRSPSSSLLGLAQMLRDPQRAPPPAQAAQRIETLAGRTLGLADGFIALARAHVIAPDRFEDLDLRDALQDALDEVWATAESRRVRIETHLSDDVATVRGDRQMLGRAITNLLTNAVKFSSPAATVTAAVTRTGHDWVISVSDSGPGIPRDRQTHLFQRFQRAVHHGDSDPGGVGLGLAFVRVVALKHRGHVEVDSDTERGATFRFAIPARSPIH